MKKSYRATHIFAHRTWNHKFRAISHFLRTHMRVSTQFKNMKMSQNPSHSSSFRTLHHSIKNTFSLIPSLCLFVEWEQKLFILLNGVLHCKGSFSKQLSNCSESPLSRFAALTPKWDEILKELKGGNVMMACMHVFECTVEDGMVGRTFDGIYSLTEKIFFCENGLIEPKCESTEAMKHSCEIKLR